MGLYRCHQSTMRTEGERNGIDVAETSDPSRFLAFGSVKADRAEVSWLVFVKLVLHPLITWWLAYHVFELEGVLPAVAVFQAALPSGVPVFVLAQQYGVFVRRSNAVIVISTLLSIVSLSVLIVVLAP